MLSMVSLSCYETARSLSSCKNSSWSISRSLPAYCSYLSIQKLIIMKSGKPTDLWLNWSNYTCTKSARRGVSELGTVCSSICLTTVSWVRWQSY